MPRKKCPTGWLSYSLKLFIPIGLYLCFLCLQEAEVKNVKFDAYHYYDDGATYTTLNLSASTIPAFTLTAILPFTQASLFGVEEALESLLGPSQLREIILLCPLAATVQARNVIRNIISSHPDSPDIRVQVFPRESSSRTIHAASQVSGWVLMLDQEGLTGENMHSRRILLQPPALSFPYGPKGICFSLFGSLEPCIRKSVGFPQEAHHLLPPFVMPAVLATPLKTVSPTDDVWRILGEHVAASRTDGIGGVVFGTKVSIESQVQSLEQALGIAGNYFDGLALPTPKYPGIFVVVLPTFEDFHWNRPHIDISIITNNRPQSLARLLSSLSNAHFYGDTVDLRMNAEQSADEETLKIVHDLVWPHGTVFIHHRIVQGGLMPAVVESWYPCSNDSYGLLLEDDIELSPMFYAWAKMALLRYRYGLPSNKSPRLFGISLYQQKNVELLPEGRRLFNARILFSRQGLLDYTTPYLSPIPCSWGAIYFPEHWREFHAYLPLRLSSQFPSKTSHLDPTAITIVPNVRSNKWTKSWKKYFIELVYLRGYVMLYPNYPDFISLSTNHLEVGSHVKVRTQEKQKEFMVPLMETANCSAVELLDLPARTLPNWDTLPVLNLTGEMATIEELAETGRVRREELIGCTGNYAPFDIRQFVCIART
ncbi:hypothetical protein C0991_005429 [Blastosporella zonata]|nr:hypothetical protein C0991_005429 [Blastosporella zonata]